MSQHQTKCPSCHAVYPMPTNKLSDPDAKARCGRCQQVFLLNDNLVVPEDPNKKKAGVNLDALNAISDDDMPPPDETPKKRTKREKPAPTGDVIFDDMDGEDTDKSTNVAFSDNELDNFLNSDFSLHNPQPMASTLDEQKVQQDDEAWVRDLLDDSKSDTPTQNSQRNYHTPQSSAMDFDNFIPVAAPPPKRTEALKKILAKKDPTTQEIASQRPFGIQLLWLFGCLLLVGVLVIQYVFFNLNTIAKNPIHASTLNKVCAIVKCAIPQADLNSLTITSDHKSKDYTTNIVINIQNTGTSPTLFPNLLVTVKDVNGQVLGDFVTSKQEYVSESQSSLLSNQNKRIMLTVHTAKFVSTVDVQPFY